MEVIIDAEFDSLTPTKLWCVVCKDINTGENHVFRYDTDPGFRHFASFSLGVDRWIGHNINCFDLPEFNNLDVGTGRDGLLANGFWRSLLHYPTVTDTLIISRLIWFQRPGGHSIENLGKEHGLKKKPIIVYDDPNLIDEYVERCIQDVEINYRIYKKDFERFVKDPEWQEAICLEHEFALICQGITNNGFGFDIERASVLVDILRSHLEKLTNEIQQTVGEVEEIDKVSVLRRKKDGTPFQKTQELLDSHPEYKNFDDGDVVTIIKSRPFNPASPKDRINLLNNAGWKPYIKTKTHTKAEQEYRRKAHLTQAEKDRWDRLKETGWQVCEENLQTLPEDAPEGAKKLAQWLTLSARLSDLEEWIGHYRADTEAIHSNIMPIGSWTHRCSHSDPNCANIFSVFHGEVRSAVDEIKDKYDALLRSQWQARKGKWLVGTDAEGIQLRVLAHLMEDEEYIEAVVNGRKEDETDVHNVNRRALELNHITRDDAKTFIYAWLLGAGTQKVGSILKCSYPVAKRSTEVFITRFPGLYELKRKRIPREAERGYFLGLDGRKVVCDSEHLMLAGHLQNGERIIMARANVIWHRRLNEMGVSFKQVNIVHDEFQTETNTEEEAHIIGRVQSEAIAQAGIDLNLKCPMKGDYKVGRNWLETH